MSDRRRSTLVVTTRADDLSLLPLADMRVMAGLDPGDDSKDADLTVRGLAIAASIMTECNIAVGKGSVNPTLLQETLTETFYGIRSSEIMLSRRHEVSLVSVTSDAVPVDLAECFVEPEEGTISHFQDDRQVRWCARNLVVVYKAGFTVIPPELTTAANDYFRSSLAESIRDQNVKAETTEIPGLETVRKEYWVGTVTGSAAATGSIPDNISSQLSRFRNDPLGF